MLLIPLKTGIDSMLNPSVHLPVVLTTPTEVYSRVCEWSIKSNAPVLIVVYISMLRNLPFPVRVL
jgi:hypothetical protein